MFYEKYNSFVILNIEQKGVVKLVIQIEPSSDIPIYTQLTNQIIEGIARGNLIPGETLPSVRALAADLGVNMHTVNKAYSLLRTEGFISLDRRIGAVVKINIDENQDRAEIYNAINLILAKAFCKNINREEIHNLVDKLYDSYEEN